MDLHEVYYNGGSPRPTFLFTVIVKYLKEKDIGVVTLEFDPLHGWQDEYMETDEMVSFCVACLASQRLVVLLRDSGMLVTRCTIERKNIDKHQLASESVTKALKKCRGEAGGFSFKLPLQYGDKEEFTIFVKSLQTMTMNFARARILPAELSQILRGDGSIGCFSLQDILFAQESQKQVVFINNYKSLAITCIYSHSDDECCTGKRY